MHNKQYVTWPQPAIQMHTTTCVTADIHPGSLQPVTTPSQMIENSPHEHTSASSGTGFDSATCDVDAVPHMHQVPVAETWAAHHSVTKCVPSSAWPESLRNTYMFNEYDSFLFLFCFLFFFLLFFISLNLYVG